MTTKTPELDSITITGRSANGYAVLGQHGHGRVVIRIAASHTKALDQFSGATARVLVEHDTFTQRAAPTVLKRLPLSREGKFTKVRLEQFIRDAYADLVARHEAGDALVADLFAAVHPREESDAITLLGTYGWRGEFAPTTLAVNDEHESEICGRRDSDGCCSCVLPEGHDESCSYL